MKQNILEEITRQRQLMSLNENPLAQGIVSGLQSAIFGGLMKDTLGLDTDSSDPTSDLGNEFKLPTNSSDDDIDYSKTPKSAKIKHNYSGEAGKNADLFINELEKAGIKDPITQLGILGVAAKESSFKMKPEISYRNTPNKRIRKIFGNRVANMSDSEISNLKQDDRRFFDAMYGNKSGMKLGNTNDGDGYRYVGRGFNGLTGRANYRKYGNLTGYDLENNPELLRKPDVAAKVAIAFFTKGNSPNTFPKFNTPEEASAYFADINAGGSSSSARTKAIEALRNFSLKV
jgi:predicted chitinase